MWRLPSTLTSTFSKYLNLMLAKKCFLTHSTFMRGVTLFCFNWRVVRSNKMYQGGIIKITWNGGKRRGRECLSHSLIIIKWTWGAFSPNFAICTHHPTTLTPLLPSATFRHRRDRRVHFRIFVRKQNLKFLTI